VGLTQNKESDTAIKQCLIQSQLKEVKEHEKRI